MTDHRQQSIGRRPKRGGGGITIKYNTCGKYEKRMVGYENTLSHFPVCIGIDLDVQLSQNTFPHPLQWCFRISSENSLWQLLGTNVIIVHIAI